MVLDEIVRYCEINNWNYRVGNIFPLYDFNLGGFPVWQHVLYSNSPASMSLSNIKLENFYTLYLKSYENSPVRFSSHPDQYVIISSAKHHVSSKSISIIHDNDLLLSVLKQDAYESDRHPINVHMGTYKGDIEEIKTRFSSSYIGGLLDMMTGKLVLENEDKGYWNVENLYNFAYKKHDIPITFDYLHHKCNPGTLTEEEAFKLCYSTWKTKPIFHYSESVIGHKNPRKHADYPTARPNTYGLDVDIDYEFKMKDLAIMSA
jgi:UV DNA damage endonuclease